jgi:hypothetical protein
MSISDSIRSRIAELEGSELFLLPTLVPGEPTVRELFVSKKVKEAVFPPWPDNHLGIRHQTFRADFDAFTEHDMRSVSENPRNKPPDTHIARVDPVEREVWDFRSLHPPGIRSFGRFGGLNLFVALTWAYREDIEPGDDWRSDDNWRAEIELCETEWARLFGDDLIFRGDTLDDYLTNYIAV